MAWLALFVLLPMGIVFGTWLGNRWGAPAVLLLFFPFPVLCVHGIQWSQGGDAALVDVVTGSLNSLPIVFGWAVPYFLFSKLFDRWEMRAAAKIVLSLIGATVVSVAVRQFATPAWETLSVSVHRGRDSRFCVRGPDRAGSVRALARQGRSQTGRGDGERARHR